MKELKKNEYRKFEAELPGFSSFRLVLSDIPAPDPEKRENRQKKMMDERKSLFQESDFVLRLIEHMAK